MTKRTRGRALVCATANWRATAALLLSIAVSGDPAFALRSQVVTTRSLAAPNAKLPEEFEFIIGVRELRDGRVLIADRREKRVVVADFRVGKVEAVSRIGDGPGEFHEVNGLHPLAADSSLLEDRQGLRWILLDGTRPVATLRTWSAGFNGPAIVGADQRGRLLETRGFIFGRNARGHTFRNSSYAESLLVLVHRRGMPRVDTIARIRGQFRGMWMTPKDIGGGHKVNYEFGNAMAAEEQALMFPDGWIAIARTNPYRVDWRTPEGRALRGRPLPLEPVRVDDRQKRAAIKRQYRVPFEPEEMKNWPDVLPPFESDALLAAPDGRLLILRMPDARFPEVTYDVVDRTGDLTERLKLRANERIIGFGARSVYVIATDDNDLQQLQRHSWP